MMVLNIQIIMGYQRLLKSFDLICEKGINNSNKTSKRIHNSFEQNLSKTIFKIMHDPRTFESLSDFSESTSNI